MEQSHMSCSLQPQQPYCGAPVPREGSSTSESYNSVPSPKRCCGATGSTAVTSHIHEVDSLPHQLECDHNRPMGSGYGEWFSDPFHQPARPKELAKPSYILQRAKLTNTGGGLNTIAIVIMADNISILSQCTFSVY